MTAGGSDCNDDVFRRRAGRAKLQYGWYLLKSALESCVRYLANDLGPAEDSRQCDLGGAGQNAFREGNRGVQRKMYNGVAAVAPLAQSDGPW